MSITTSRRFGAAALGGSLLASGLVLAGPAPVTHAHGSDPRPSQLGASWLAGALTGGLIHNDQYDFDDYGATVEAAYTFDAVGADAQIQPIADALEANADAYTSPGSDVYAGSTGKLLSFVLDLTSADPESFGGVNLVDQMEGVTANSGRIADVSDWGDFSNMFGQAWAVRGLTLAGSDEAPAATEFLLDRQCDAGYFNLDFSTPCTDPVPPVDTTAQVVILLADLDFTDPALTSARDASVAEAVDWIESQQAPDGSFDGGTAAEGPNANSTGLGGQALARSAHHEAAEQAAAWIRGRQVAGLACEGALAGETGAIAYNDAAYAAGATDGITDVTSGQWDFSTIQALPALVMAPASEQGEISIGRTPAFLDGGSRRVVVIHGLAPGERTCASIGRNTRRAVGNGDGKAWLRIRVPDRTGRVAIKATAIDQEAVRTGGVVLSAKRLRLATRSSVAPRGRQRIVVRGLWAGEPVVVKNDGAVVARGRANGNGRFVTKYGVGRQRGKHKVVVIGRFQDRRNAASYRVG